jgi:hypothetical protein
MDGTRMKNGTVMRKSSLPAATNPMEVTIVICLGLLGSILE